MVQYYVVCRRKLWLHGAGIGMEQDSDRVAQGKVVHEQTYKRRSGPFTEIALGGIKIDHYDPKARVVHEVKLAPRMEPAHLAQLRYYLLCLRRAGIEATGRLEYPKQRRTLEVLLSERDALELEGMEREIVATVRAEAAPPRLRQSFCRTCAFYDFCWAEEDDD